MFLSKMAHAASADGEAIIVFEMFGLEVASEIITMWGVMVLLTVAFYLGTKNLQRIPGKFQNFLEFVIEGLMNFLSDVIGPKQTRKYFPLLATFFICILVSNYTGILPGAGHVPGVKPPTSNLSVTATLAIIVAGSVIFYGIKAKGLGYFKHFLEPVPILLPITVMEQFIRPLSLSLRLYGNIFGEEMVVFGLTSLMPLFLPIPMQLLGLLFGFIQAFVFTLLAAMYIDEATAEHH